MKTVLVVEDTQAERKLISALLKYAGFIVSAVDSVESALDWLNDNPLPNLVLLDIILPGESGLDLCRQIRSNEKWKDIPVLFCSSKSEDFDRFWAMRQGGNDYLTKPFAPKQLLDSVYENIS